MWLNDVENSVCVGGESVKQLGERIMKALNKIAKENDGKTVAIVTHATPIRVSQCLIETGALNEMKNIPWVTNASVTIFEHDQNGWKVIDASRDEHLTELKTKLHSSV